MPRRTANFRASMLACATLATFLPLSPAQARFRVLYSFQGGNDGAGPTGLMRKAGNLYGTTALGGPANAGTVFEVSGRTETVLHAFKGGSDGTDPIFGVVEDKSDNLYGVTCGCGFGPGFGTVYKLASDGTETTLYTFSGGSDGGDPEAALIRDKAGNLYGTTIQGGSNGCGGFGCGIVFELAPNGIETVLHAFGQGTDGWGPSVGVIRDKAGNLFGTTDAGGVNGGGTVFKLAPNDTETVLYSFSLFGKDGTSPFASLIADDQGNLYGTTFEGGNSGCQGTGCGVVFKVTPNSQESVLYTFTGGNDGAQPYSGLTADAAGNLYGTTIEGGAKGYGVVFRLAPDGTLTVLHAFTGGKDGAGPGDSSLVADGKGHLYGTAFGGGSAGGGTVFRVDE